MKTFNYKEFQVYSLKRLVKYHHKAMELVKMGGKKDFKKRDRGTVSNTLLEVNSSHIAK